MPCGCGVEPKPGAFTGEMCASMLADVGCKWVVLGHSERRHGYHGETSAQVATKTAQAVEADAAGLQLAVHAIGDRAVDEVVALYERVIRHNGRQTRRHRIEHVQHIAGPATAARMAASVSPPATLTSQAPWALRQLTDTPRPA